MMAFDHPLLRGLLGDPDTERWLSAEAEVQALIDFEIALADAESAEGVVLADAAEAVVRALRGYQPDLAALSEGAARDGVVVPALVRTVRKDLSEEHARSLHFGATSQDAADSGLMIRLKGLTTLFESKLEALESSLEALSVQFGAVEIMGRTRMQDALPIRAADRIGAWRGPLSRLRGDLSANSFAVQFGGPVGTLAELGDKGPAVRARLAAALGLADAPCWHSQRDRIVRYGDWLATISGSLGKMGQDIALMALLGELKIRGAGGSSSMVHKQNPVAAEALVALARYGATLIGGLHHAQVHEFERSGAAWTLEWLTLPQLAMTTGAGLRLALALIGSIEQMGGSQRG
jgi:3-carboxy-cis,cis-muconate cycloisomerase